MLRAKIHLTEREQKIQDDHEWVRTSRQLHRKYGGKVVAVHNLFIYGVGSNHEEALQDALTKPHCPIRDLLTFVVVPEW